MGTIWVYTLLSVLIVSLMSFVGILFLSFKQNFLQKIIFILVSFAVGAMFGGSFFHLIPEIMEKHSHNLAPSINIMIGIIVFFILEKFLHWHHDHDVNHEFISTKPLGILTLTSDSFHNFIDGILIGSAYLVDIKLGIATTIAIVLHEIPQEIGEFGILIHAGFKKTKALLFNFLSACFSILGAILTLLLGEFINDLQYIVIAFAAGGFIYIAGSDLIPELHKKNEFWQSLIQLISIIAGLLLMYLFAYYGHSH